MNDSPQAHTPCGPGTTGLILSGGGARAAYQVGVLQAINELLPDNKFNPFPVICGTSAGAINALALETNATDFSYAVQRMHEVWSLTGRVCWPRRCAGPDPT